MISKELFKYMILTLFMGFAAACLMAPRFIPLLHRLKFGQEVRDDGPKAHLKKQGTPTMGGIFIVISVLIAVLLGTLGYGFDKEALMVLFISIAFGAIGFTDDYLKIRKHQSEGLKPLQKLSMQLIVTLVFAWLVYEHGSMGGKLWIPFMGVGDEARLWLDLPAVIYFPLVIFTVLGTDNGVNFTDGLDGLCSSVTAVAAAFSLSADCFTDQESVLPRLHSAAPLWPFCFIMFIRQRCLWGIPVPWLWAASYQAQRW